jgi:hypothetical protein
MTRIFARSLLLASLLSGAAGGGAAEEIVVIAHPTLPKADRPTLLRLYTGRTVSIGMQSVTPLNLSAGNPLREKFLKDCLEQTEEQYTGYWLVRRYVGRGRRRPSCRASTRCSGMFRTTRAPWGMCRSPDCRATPMWFSGAEPALKRLAFSAGSAKLKSCRLCSKTGMLWRYPLRCWRFYGSYRREYFLRLPCSTPDGE